jgi:hypothetical protein
LHKLGDLLEQLVLAGGLAEHLVKGERAALVARVGGVLNAQAVELLGALDRGLRLVVHIDAVIG